MGSNRFDIIIIGAGACGLGIASFMNRRGFAVLLIDKSPSHIGGDSLNNGCASSKSLLHIASRIRAGRDASVFGYSLEGSADMGKIIEAISSQANALRAHKDISSLQKEGITVVLGEASFANAKSVVVGGIRYVGKKIVIATGSRPRPLEVDGISDARVFTHENIFSITFLPKRLLVVGAGPTGIELGQAFSALGSHVSIVDVEDRILPREDREISEILLSRLKKQGISFYLKRNIESIRGGRQMIVSKENQVEEAIAFDALLVAIGGVPNIENLKLEDAGIRVEKNTIVVDAYLRTSNKRVLVCGDALEGPQFTHDVQEHEKIILHNLFSFFKKKYRKGIYARVTHGDPEVATFGVSEDELKRRKVPFKTYRYRFENDECAIIGSYQYGLLKVQCTPRGRILGGSMIAPYAGELIQELIYIMTHGHTLNTLLKKIYPYSSMTRVNRSLALNQEAEKLTPFAKKMFRLFFH